MDTSGYWQSASAALFSRICRATSSRYGFCLIEFSFARTIGYHPRSPPETGPDPPGWLKSVSSVPPADSRLTHTLQTEPVCFPGSCKCKGHRTTFHEARFASDRQKWSIFKLSLWTAVSRFCMKSPTGLFKLAFSVRQICRYVFLGLLNDEEVLVPVSGKKTSYGNSQYKKDWQEAEKRPPHTQCVVFSMPVTRSIPQRPD